MNTRRAAAATMRTSRTTLGSASRPPQVGQPPRPLEASLVTVGKAAVSIAPPFGYHPRPTWIDPA